MIKPRDERVKSPIDACIKERNFLSDNTFDPVK
jgi:hypothetical protein